MTRLLNLTPFLALFLGLLMITPLSTQGADLADLAEKEELTIVVTDSGLGGLSVAADIAARVEKHATHKRVNLIFYNALFDEHTGYNSLESRDDRVRIFNNSLVDMANRYEPDLIMVACNTLSVLLPDCDYAQNGDVPVLGIVESGVELIDDALSNDPEARVMIFATPGTIDEDSHRAALIERGIDAERILGVPCRDLTFYIEQEFDGFDTELMIAGFVDDAAQMLADRGIPIYASFNCTHFGYSTELWQQEIDGAGLQLRGMLDPNNRMADFLFEERLYNRFDDPQVEVSFVTMVPISEHAIASIGRAIRPTSPKAAEALENYQLVEDLFPWRDGAVAE